MTPDRKKADGNQKVVTELDSCTTGCSYDFINTFHMFGNLGKVHLPGLELLLYSPSSICYWQLSKRILLDSRREFGSKLPYYFFLKGLRFGVVILCPLATSVYMHYTQTCREQKYAGKPIFDIKV